MKWVTTWGNAQSTVVPQPTKYAKNLTLRYPLYTALGGKKIRITLDNYCCDEDVKIDNVYISLSNKQSSDVASFIPLTFNGKNEASIKAFDNIISDELEIDVLPNTYIVVSMYIPDYINLTSGVDIVGPLSKGYYAYGNQATNNKLDINTSKSTSWVYFLANLDIYTDDNNYCVICYGDSITSQDWPDCMQMSLIDNGINNIAIVRKAVSGTRILRQYECITYQSYGLCGKNRFNHEIGSVCGAKKLIIQHGINDIIHPVGEEVNIFRPMSDMPSALDLVDGLNYYIEEAKKYDLEVYVGNLLPIYNWRTYADFREIVKNEFNTYIKTLNYIDFEAEIGDYIDGAWRFKEACDSGDHLHPSKYAYKLMGALAAKKIMK